jgi:hypothetical protein
MQGVWAGVLRGGNVERMRFGDGLSRSRDKARAKCRDRTGYVVMGVRDEFGR